MQCFSSQSSRQAEPINCTSFLVSYKKLFCGEVVAKNCSEARLVQVVY